MGRGASKGSRPPPPPPPLPTALRVTGATAGAPANGSPSMDPVFLTWSKIGGGLVASNYVRVQPEGTIIKAVCSKTIPAHKYKGAGQVPIKTNCTERKDFFNGVCSYLKEVRPYGAQFEITGQGPHGLMIVKHTSTGKIEKCLEGAPFNLNDADAACACPPAADAFNSPTMTMAGFVERAKLQYGCAEFQ